MTVEPIPYTTMMPQTGAHRFDSLKSEEKKKYRIEHDSLGDVRVNANNLWGAQTQRSLQNFQFGPRECMPVEVVKALALLKKVAAQANVEMNLLAVDLGSAIVKAADEILEGKHDSMFPLSIWQTGSGTQSNMNMNEVISNRAIELLGGAVGSRSPVHPNNHVNLNQSSNDVFPSALTIALCQTLNDKLYPAMEDLIECMKAKETEFGCVVKLGRTHMMDAVPMRLSSEVSAWRAGVEMCLGLLREQEHSYLRNGLALGGTAVGSGLNAAKGFDALFAKKLSEIMRTDFQTSSNKYFAISCQSPSVVIMGSLNTLATTLMKMVNDIRLLSSGPRAGIGELILPANEPGSSIMPGKVNPTQCESMAMVCAQVIGNNVAVTTANIHGFLQLNVFLPLIADNCIRSINLLSNSIRNFINRCLKGLTVDQPKCQAYLNSSLMLVTCLNPHLGYDKAAEIALNAHTKGITLKESAIELNYLTSEQFDQMVNATAMADACL